MTSIKVLAHNVTNLTDARYFAARLVDYLLFDLSVIGIEKIWEIGEWVSGPQILLVFDDDTIHLIDEALIKIKPDYFALRAGTSFDPSHLTSYYNLFHYSQDKDKIDIIIDQEFFSSFKSSPDQLEEFLKSNSLDGIIVDGGSESHVGVKSFDDLDDLFDVIYP